jgi:hypothetical protein
MNIKIFLVSLLGLIILSECQNCNCPPGPDPSPPPAVTHPPVNKNLTAKPSDLSDHSSIDVYTNTYAYTDATKTTAWYNQNNDFRMLPIPVQTVKWGDNLAMFDLEPSGLVFTSPAGSKLPVLSYDLFKYDPAFLNKDLTHEYLKTITSVYQVMKYHPEYLPSFPWELVANATREQDTSGYYYARADLPHFSQFALVKLPAPRDFVSDKQVTLGVGSTFMTDGKDILVIFENIPEKSLGLAETKYHSRIFRLVGVSPSSLKVNNQPANSPDLASVAERLTQEFKFGTELIWARQTGKVIMTQKDKVELNIANVQIY